MPGLGRKTETAGNFRRWRKSDGKKQRAKDTLHSAGGRPRMVMREVHIPPLRRFYRRLQDLHPAWSPVDEAVV
ncbi:hypothetical protein M407DRAFT_18806 [Tulasnella calospora MUT 4182]|uniref:Uncharacterized protein n=1 Tax=Tulasnella calospora MUT 4182 TaxID=1051891 RepID=A0A0C3MER0_9AGAM|nr:hypothetical protein M407DRAFT_18806 [Tulasnella calospora MUT 4182]